MSSRTYILAGDFQCPYHDPEAVDILCRVGEDLREATTQLSLVLMGDFVDFSQIGRYPTQVMEDLRRSHEQAQSLLSDIDLRIRPNGRKIWLDGNHEERLLRQMISTPQMAQILNLPTVANAVAIPTLMKLAERCFEYVGPWGYGTWLPTDDVNSDRYRSVYVEHGNMTSQKAGYSVHRHGARNMVSTVIGHCHRLGIVWHTVPSVNGQVQDFLFAECGTMSLLGVPGKGDNLYNSVPHRNPQIMNTQQGFLVLTLDEYGDWYAEAVKITRGQAFFRGRTYGLETRQLAA